MYEQFLTQDIAGVVCFLQCQSEKFLHEDHNVAKFISILR